MSELVGGREEHDFGPYPDPASTDPDRPGLRPGRHRDGFIYSWVFLQDRLWVDRFGNEHEISKMDLAYVRNVAAFLERRSEDVRSILYGESAGRALEQLLDGDHRGAAKTIAAVCTLAEADPLELLETTALMVALRRRLADDAREEAAGDD